MRFFMPKAGFTMSLFLVIPTLIGATPSNFDENTQFLIEKINIYVKNTQNGDYTKAIADFDTDDDDALILLNSYPSPRWTLVLMLREALGKTHHGLL